MKFALISLIITIILIVLFIFWDKILNFALGGNWILKALIGSISQTCCLIIIGLAVIVTLALIIAKK